jgi:hypothetical protein
VKQIAELHSFDINYRCPNCRLFFRVSWGSDFLVSRKVTCDSCGEKLKVKPIMTDRNVWTGMNSKTISEVINVMVNLGWSKEEASVSVHKVEDKESLPADVLLKLALSGAKDETNIS